MNKKIKNATVREYNGIKFKSSLEVTIYKILQEKNFNPQYEAVKYTIWEGIKPKIPYYDRLGKQGFKLRDNKFVDIHYNPDITFTFNDYTVIIEAKGFSNGVWDYKSKMFVKWLGEQPNKYIYAVIRTKKELLYFLELLNTKYNTFS